MTSRAPLRVVTVAECRALPAVASAGSTPAHGAVLGVAEVVIVT
ncbi:MAG: hypothetical protein RI885_1226 [Actinomycetota bacterium]|jgi:hypothetical protein